MVFGAGERGTATALRVSARFSFLLFWIAYAGSPLTALFGATFQPLKKRARVWSRLCCCASRPYRPGRMALLDRPPPAFGVFVFFGIAVLFTYLLALFSIGNLQQVLGPRWWWLLRTLGMNYIAYAFFTDFMNNPLDVSIKHLVSYLPFAILVVAGPFLRLAAWSLHMRDRWLRI